MLRAAAAFLCVVYARTDCASAGSNCGDCLASGGSSCGWCSTHNVCLAGNKFGPDTPSDCGTWNWYYVWCPGSADDPCTPEPSCEACMANNQNTRPCCEAPCNWCTNSVGDGRCVAGDIGGPATGRCTGQVRTHYNTNLHPLRRPVTPPSLVIASLAEHSTTLVFTSSAQWRQPQ